MRLGTIAFLIGIVIFQQLSVLPDSRWAILIFLSLPFSFAIIPARFRFKLPLRLLCWMLTGFLLTLLVASNIASSRLSPEIEGQDVLVDGLIVTIPEQRQRHSRFEFLISGSSNKAIPLKMLPKRIRLNWYVNPTLHAGERWQLLVRLKQPHGFMNPGGFDYESWLFRHKIRATGYVRKSKENRRLAEASEMSVLFWRERLSLAINEALPQSQFKGIITALAIGQRDAITRQQWQVLLKTGTNHLVAISGLHVGLVSGLAFLFIYWLWSRSSILLTHWPAKKAAAVAAIIVALVYAALAGFSIPTQRAFIMVSVFMGSILLQRCQRPADGLALAMLVVLVLDPLSVMDAGFWLSFSAVAIILYAMSGRLSTKGLWWKWGRMHFVLGVALVPLTLLLFQKASLISPLANFIAVPFISLLVVPLVLIGALLLLVTPTLGTAVLQVVDWCLSHFWPLMDAMSAFEYSQMHFGLLGPSLMLPAIVAIVWLLAPRGWPARWLGGIWLVVLFFLPLPRPNPGEAWFTLLDVGQGLSAVVQTHQHVLLYDAGPAFNKNFDTGEMVVVPFLREQGLNNIDMMIVSHGDNDHIGGAASVLSVMPTKRLLSSVPEQLPAEQAEACYSGQAWQWDGVDFEVLLPFHQQTLSENDNSCVLKVSTAAGSVLLTGDIEKAAENILIDRQSKKLQSTILLVPHHGSKTSSTTAFIDAVSPDVALIPVGYRNRFKLPRQEVVDRYRARNIEILESARLGALQIRLGRDEISTPTGFRTENRRYWTHLP